VQWLSSRKVVSTDEMASVPKVLVGPEVRGLSASTVSRLKLAWAEDYQVSRLTKDQEELMAFYDFPAQHWQSIRTSNPIEST